MSDGRRVPLQTAARDRLAARMTDFTVEEFPDESDRFPVKADRTLLVAFGDGSYTEVGSSVADCQRELQVHILMRSLSGPKGLQSTVSRVVSHLIGWRPPSGGTHLIPVRDQLVGEDNGQWHVLVVMQQATTVMAYADPQQDEFFGPPTEESDMTVEKP